MASSRPTSLVLAKTSTGSMTTAAPPFRHQLSEPVVDKHRKLSESRGVHLPNIKIVGETMTMSPAPQTAFSPIGTVIRRELPTISATPMSPTVRAVMTVDLEVYLPTMKFIKLCMEMTPDGMSVASSTVLKSVADVLGIPLATVTEAFAMWMTSPLMQLQLKPHHSAWEVRKVWRQLLGKYIVPSADHPKHVDPLEVDLPVLSLKRNYILSKTRERQLRADTDVLALLFAEARERHMDGRSPCSTGEAIRLAAIDLAVNQGEYDKEIHTCEWLRDVLPDVVPVCHLAKVRCKRLFGYALHACGSDAQINNEQQVLAEYRKSSTLPVETLHRHYLDLCMQRPCYGSAQFRCHIERATSSGNGIVQRIRGTSLSATVAVRLCISREFITIYEWRDAPSTDIILLVRPLLDCQWFRAPAAANDEQYKVKEPINARDLKLMPSIILHYAEDTTPHVSETSNGTEIHGINEEASSCLLQIFTRQTPMISALLDACVTSTEVELTQRLGVERLNNDVTEDEEVPLDDVIGRCVDDRLPITSPLRGRERGEILAKAHLDGSGKCINSTPGSNIRKLIESNSPTSDSSKSDTVVVFRETTT